MCDVSWLCCGLVKSGLVYGDNNNHMEEKVTETQSKLSPSSSQTEKIPQISKTIIRAVGRYFRNCASELEGTQHLSPFVPALNQVYAITELDYIVRCTHYMQMSESTLLGVLVLARRIYTLNPKLLCRGAFFRMFAALSLLSSKLIEDDVIAHVYCANVCGVLPSELAQLELYVAKYLNFNLFIGVGDLENVRQMVCGSK